MTALVGYSRLDLGVPLQGEHVRLIPKRRAWRVPVAPGATYRIVAWGVKGTRDRSQLPRVLTVKTKESGKFMPTCMGSISVLVFDAHWSTLQLHLLQDTSL